MTETQGWFGEHEALWTAIETVHQTGSIRNHSDPNDKTGWHVHGIETCEDTLCVDGLAALARSESPSPEGLTYVPMLHQRRAAGSPARLSDAGGHGGPAAVAASRPGHDGRP